jgi:hypothetical protein
VALNRLRNVDCHRLALGRGAAEVKFSSALGEDPRAVVGDRAEDGPSINVPMNTGEALLADVPPTARGVCKIDVEGFEYEVVSGMRSFIASYPGFAFCVEITSDWIRRQSGVEAGAVIDLFGQCGFETFLMDRHGALAPLTVLPTEQFDAVFVRRL